MATVGSLKLDLIIDGKKAEVTISNVEKDFDKLGNTGEQAGGKIESGFSKAKMGIMAAAGAITGLFIGMNKLVSIASDYNEANSKMLTIFDEMPDAARKAKKDLVSLYGMSNREAVKLLGSTGDLLTGLGMQQDAALDLSYATQTLSADLASFSNAQGGAEAVSKALTSAMLGERDSLKTYGIVISEAMVKEELAAKGKDKLTGLALNQAKAEATLTIAMRQSTNAIGDLARTQDSYANTQRRVANATEDVGLAMGGILLPIWNEFMLMLDDMFKALNPAKIAAALYGVWEVIKDFGRRIYDFFAGWGMYFVHLFTGNFKALQADSKRMFDAIASDWDVTVFKIGMGMIRGERNTKQFMDGVVASQKAAQNAMTQTTGTMLTENERMMLEVSERTNAMIAGMAQQNVVITQEALGEQSEYVEQESEWYDEMQIKKEQSYVSSLSNGLRALASTSKTAFKFWKGSAYAKIVMDTLSAAQASAKVGLPWSVPLVAADLAAGAGRALQVSKMKFRPMAVGGEINTPTLALMGEAGSEIVAPKDDFINVVNTMISGGELGTAQTDNMTSGITSGIINGLANAVFNIDFDSETLALSVERGNNLLARSEV
jgi:hypothetical protein